MIHVIGSVVSEDGQTDGKTDRVTALLDLLSPLATLQSSIFGGIKTFFLAN